MPFAVNTFVDVDVQHRRFGVLLDVQRTILDAIPPADNLMRITLAIDDDVLAAAKSLAERQHKSVGEVISLLARQSLRKGEHEDVATTLRNCLPLLMPSPGVESVTLEMVNHLRNELP